MKKLLRIILCSAVLFCMMSVTAFADMAPKPKITVKLENAPEGVYYMDLLAPVYGIPHPQGKPDEETAAKYNSEMLELLFGMSGDGWYPAIATEYSMTWGELTSSDGVHTFSYHPPTRFRIIIVTEKGNVSISKEIKRNTFRPVITLDYETMDYTLAPVWQVYPAQFVSAFVPTIIIEYLVLLAFGLKNKNNVKYFLIANFTTQLVLNTMLAATMIKEGWGGFLFGRILLIGPEIIIALCESIYYKKKFTDCDQSYRFKYGLLANTFSALATLVCLQPMLDNMARIAGF